MTDKTLVVNNAEPNMNKEIKHFRSCDFIFHRRTANQTSWRKYLYLQSQDEQSSSLPDIWPYVEFETCIFT